MMNMTIKNIFEQKQSFDLENCKSLKEIVHTEFQLENFETYYSDKHESDYAVLQTKDGQLYDTWSFVVIQKLKQLKEYPAEEWKALTLQAVPKESKNNFTYIDLLLIG